MRTKCDHSKREKNEREREREGERERERESRATESERVRILSYKIKKGIRKEKGRNIIKSWRDEKESEREIDKCVCVCLCLLERGREREGRGKLSGGLAEVLASKGNNDYEKHFWVPPDLRIDKMKKI